MTQVNSAGYLVRHPHGGRMPLGHKLEKANDIYLVKERVYGRGTVMLREVLLPNHLVGRRVRFKMEVLPEDKPEGELPKWMEANK